MDQNSSNGPVTEKRNWRERLGIGSKDMPKIADEFRAERPAPPLGSSSVKAPKPIAKPAPMAPRNVAPKVVAPKIAVPKNVPRPAQDNQHSALAEKLRAQREAAEKLAAQRVTAARERAETRISPEPRLRPTQQEGRAELSAGRPKFTFADETAPPAFQPKQSSNGLPPLLPPRPALGGDRPPGFSTRGAGYAPPNGGYRQEPPAGFRPIDPATGYPGRQPAGSVSRNFPPLGGNSAPALPAGRRQASPPAFDDRYLVEDEDFRGDPRLTRSMARQQPIAEAGDDVFDEPAQPAHGRRRASAAEYNAAYREAEEGYAEPGRRSGGPWLLLFALLVAAVATGGIVWYYQTKVKPVASVGSGTTTESVPVVAAPVEPVKTAAETPAEQAVVVEPTNKKQIYDRIVGDQEVLGEAMLAPSEQTPIQPEAQSSGQDGQTGSELIPAPAGTQGTDDAEPLPLPPPPGENGTNTQGVLDGTQVQPAATGTESADANAETIGSLVEKSATDTSAAVETPPVSGSDSTAAATEQVPQLENVGQEPEAAQPVEVKKPATPVKKVAAKPAKKPAKAKAKPDESTGTDPVVIVPPSQGTETAPEAIDIGGGTAVGQDGAVTGEAVTPPKKKKTIFDLFKGKNASAGDTAAPAEQQETQVASNAVTQEETASTSNTAAAKATGGAGYVAQLASFRSQAEAQAEFNRLKGKYPDALGGKQANISTATVAGSKRYRLGVGPMASRDEAQKVCGSLLANGERDCLVRKQ